MLVLGIDTATRRASVGLIADGSILAEQSRLADASHAVSLLPLIDSVLAAAAVQVDELDAVAVSAGPGSFTGLRVGLSIAKGLTYATGARLVTVPTLEALARAVPAGDEPVCALLDARKGELYAACFSRAAEFQWTMDERLLTPEQLMEVLPRPVVVIGDAVPRYGAWLRERAGDAVRLLPFEIHGPRGSIVAQLGRQSLQSVGGGADDTAEPAYIRLCDAERNRK